MVQGRILDRYKLRGLQDGTPITQFNVENSGDAQYFTTLWVGSLRTPMKFLIDTGSSWLWIPSVDCATCIRSKFNYKTSLSFTSTNSVYRLAYGQGSVLGNASSDTLSLFANGTMNATGTKFLLVNQSANFTTLMPDGILGLTPGFIDRDI